MRWERDMFIIGSVQWGIWGALGLGFSQYMFVNRCRVSLCLAVCGAGLRCCACGLPLRFAHGPMGAHIGHNTLNGG